MHKNRVFIQLFVSISFGVLLASLVLVGLSLAAGVRARGGVGAFVSSISDVSGAPGWALENQGDGGIMAVPSEREGEQDATKQEIIATSADESMPMPWYRGKLVSAGEVQDYDSIREGIYELSDDIRLPCALSAQDDLSRVYQYVVNDNPDIFWLSQSFSYEMDSDGGIVSVSPKYKITDPAEIGDLKKAIDAKVSQAVSYVNEASDGARGRGDYQKVKRVYSWVCDNVSYDGSLDDDQDVESSLVYGRSACAGYSRAFQLICSEVGIPCIYVTGPARSNGSTVLHAWNAVAIDGIVSYVDVTWGDKDDNVPTDYAWLALSLDDISRTHFAEDGSVIPKAPSNAYEIWSLNGGYFDSYDKDSVTSYLLSVLDSMDDGDLSSSGKASASIRFPDDDSMEKAFSSLADDPSIAFTVYRESGREFKDPYGESGVFSVYKNDSLDSITIVFNL